MKYLDFEVDLPDRLLHPMGAFVRREDVVAYEELLTWNVQPDEGVEYELFYAEADPEAYREAVSEVESIVDYQVAPIDEDALHVWACERTRPEVRAWRGAFHDRQLVLVPPVRFDDHARMGMTVVGDGGDIRDVLAEMPDAVGVTVNEIGTYDSRGGTLAGALTDSQRRAVATALDLGYYAVPREATLSEVAAALDRAQSSTSLLLRRAERDLFARVFDRYGMDTASAESAVPDGGASH